MKLPSQQRANTVDQSGNTQCWLESEKCGAGAKCASPSDHPPQNFSTSQRGKSQAASRANVCAACRQIPSVLRQQIQKDWERRNPTSTTYLLRREVQREREGGFPLPSSAFSSPLSPAHFLGFLVSRVFWEVVGGQGEKLPKATQRRCLNEPDFTSTPAPLSSASSDTASFGPLTSQTTFVDLRWPMFAQNKNREITQRHLLTPRRARHY